MPASTHAQRFVVGRPMAVAGIAMMTLALAFVAGLVFLATRPDDLPATVRIGLVILTAFPLLIAVLGFWLSFAGHRLVIDTTANQLRIAYGLWYVWQRENIPLAEFDAVTLARQSTRVSADDHGSTPSHVVRLCGPAHDCELLQRTDLHDARKEAERICEALNLPLHDETDGDTLVRAPDQLNQSLAQRTRRLGEDADWPRTSKAVRIVTQAQPGIVRLLLPAPDAELIREGIFGLGFLLLIYGGAAYAIGRMASYGLQQAGWEAWTPLAWGIVLVPLLGMLLFGLTLLFAREELHITHGNLSRTWRLGPLQRPVTLQNANIEELRSDANEILLRTDDQTLRIGFALRKAETAWLADAVRCLLVHGPNAAKIR